MSKEYAILISEMTEEAFDRIHSRTFNLLIQNIKVRIEDMAKRGGNYIIFDLKNAFDGNEDVEPFPGVISSFKQKIAMYFQDECKFLSSQIMTRLVSPGALVYNELV